MLGISYEGATAVITTVGAGLRSFEVDGVPYVETFGEDEKPPMSAGAVLVPWPNRTAGASWVLDGVVQQLEVTEPARGNAIHGLVRRRPWSVLEHTGSLVSLRTLIEPQAGWPAALDVTVSYALDDRGLTVTHGVTNIGKLATPFGVGTHPYPRAGRASTDSCTLTLAATSVLPLDVERMVPSGDAVSVEGTEFDFRGGRSLAGVRLDTPFGGCEPGGDGLVHHSLVADDGGGVEVWADPEFRWVQVYTPDSYPDRGRAVAVEPMTCPPDALNSGVDLIWVAPGESWGARWGIRPFEAPV
ncbi:aldose 1-epimerase family protein [Lentzea sp. BCCO 10_0856]|uniref:Aldose 1-epimerase family protein n=1 Tax=Lentzea miocenica TaxID=3095431 RepID=A0ABU4TFY8_9PSEU|nr:aldose 1-epimerase family protein [Lentzea sp. BCCO 10_0856]MDX8036792.1 aldose 1-epimerase family protein [Lentzea sp. BCCO 10_0856]